jgi:4-amino-4-deoxy-L-arabinose transferase-like glycosyltransferase
MGLQSWQSVAWRRTLLSARHSPDAAALGLIIVFLGFRLVLAATLGLGVDESYAIANARELELSYFDHPPLHYWIAHAFMPLVGDGRALRLPFIILFAGSSWLLYRLTRRLFGDWAGVWAMLALNLSAFFTLSAGGWIVPDGALFFFLLAAALTLANAFFPAAASASPWRSWILAGIYLGLASLAKYQAVLFGFGLLLYLVSIPGRRRVLLHPAPWAGALIALAIFSPVLIWNAQHGWVSFAYQGGRGLAQGGLHAGNALANAAGQAVWILPWIFVPLAIAVWQALRAGRRQERSWYCLCLGLPTIVFFTVIPLWGDRGLPHWPMSGWLMLYPILGAYLDGLVAGKAAAPRRWAISSAALLVVLAAVALGQAATGYGKLLFPAAFAHGDPTLEAVAWTPLRAELKARGYLDGNMFVVAPNWMDAGRIDQALDGALPVTVFGDLTEAKNFDFSDDPKSWLGRDALVIGRTITPDKQARLGPYFQSIEELPPVSFGRSGMREIELHILLAKKLKMPLPSFDSKRRG